MDKFVRKLARQPSSIQGGANKENEASNDRYAKRIKTGEHQLISGNQNECIADGLKHSESTKEKESMPLRAASGDDAKSDDEGSGSDSMLVSDGYDRLSDEGPLALIDPLEEKFHEDQDVPVLNDNERDETLPKKRASIYVDAFNIALDTVLEQEEHLFNEKERAIFQAWRQLDYEAKYLYVRLFLRKECAWHRTQRLGYYSDISDLQAAIDVLQQTRELPICSEDPTEEAFCSAYVPQDWALGPSFVFIESFDRCNPTIRDAVSLLSLDELKDMAKQMKINGKNKADLQSALVEKSTKQMTLISMGLRRHSSTDSTAEALVPRLSRADSTESACRGRDNSSSDHEQRLFQRIMAATGPCIRISAPVFKLFERVHLVFYRTSEWTEKSLTAIVLAKISKRNFPPYVVCRTANIFESRQQLLDFEDALRLQYKIDQLLNFDGPAGEDAFREVVRSFEAISGRWRQLMRDEQHRDKQRLDFNDASYLRQFKAAHVYTRIAHYAAYSLGRLHEYRQEYVLIDELLEQRLWQMARRGGWYQRKALLQEHYMAVADPDPKYSNAEQQKKHWRRMALQTCEQALEDRDCHLIYHYNLQKRILKLEKRLRIPRRLQHDFGHLRLLAPEEHFVEGVQIKRENAEDNTKTIWVDELEDGSDCSVEEMCLSHYRKNGWKGYHSEGGIVRTLFAYLFYDILFLYIPNVFQTPYQTCPLDLHTDVFYEARASEINRRLVDIANGEAARIVRDVHAAHFERRTCVVGLKWDFQLEDVVEVVQCFNGDALAMVCKVLAQEYRQRGSGLPDLLLWRMEPKPEILFAEVKSASDRLSDTQRMWIHVLAGAGVRVAVCHAVAREVRIRQ